ncbi:MAG TPA: sugar phosphate nucleotidyltransferase [Myxococcota bacterium]|jgi:UTP--glucose-1-phosphate uridylyltransferase|nr:sugar phosphate nucleotidyltransferase [Myxococcota bacterium]
MADRVAPSPLPPSPPPPPLPPSSRRTHVRCAVVPAAGLGTRLLPATLVTPKELLPLGRYPALVAVLLEAVAAQIEEMAIVVGPGKEPLRRLLDPEQWGHAGPHPALAPLHALLKMVRVRVVEQPEPVGVLDALERGRMALPAGPCAVLFPDLVHLPDQRALLTLLQAHDACHETVFGLCDAGAATPGRMGASARVDLLEEEDHDTLNDRPPDPGVPRRIAAVYSGDTPPAPGELRTTFGLVETAAYIEALALVARPGEGSPLDDDRYLDALNRLAGEGRLYGTMLPGEVLDLGVPAGYQDAVRRFALGEARWRDLPP